MDRHAHAAFFSGITTTGVDGFSISAGFLTGSRAISSSACASLAFRQSGIRSIASQNCCFVSVIFVILWKGAASLRLKRQLSPLVCRPASPDPLIRTNLKSSEADSRDA